ncbi:serine/threonine-protein kinase Sgk2 [Trichoderma ceciliae]
MAHFTQEERDAIGHNPLGELLNAVREVLRETEPNASSEFPSDDSADAPERPRLFVAAIGKLLSILSASDVSLSLDSRTGRESLFADLGVVRSRLLMGDVAYQHCRPLSKLVIKQAQDVDVWAAVIALIQAVSHSTPPPSLPASLETPMTHSSASQQGSEQTRQKVELRVFEEIQHCTHRAVGGFHEKYFQGNKWNRRAKQIWQRARRHYSDDDKRWTQLPDAPTEDEVCGWLLNLQQELLADERAAYFRSTAGNMVGTEAQRQLDLFVKMKRDEAADAKHEWRDVLVIGEVKKSDQKSKALWLQIGSAARNVFAGQPTRLFVHAFSLTGTEMETWVFDRSGPYSGATFDIHDEPDKFIQVMCGYLMMSDVELGLDTFITKKDNRLFVTIPIEVRPTTNRKRKLELHPDPIAFQRAIVCRGTSCFLAKDVGTTEFDTVVKFSWTSSMRPPEADLLNRARERGVRGLAKVVGYYEEVTSIRKLREHLVFSTPHKFRGVPRSASTSFSQPHFTQFPSLSIASTAIGKRKSKDGASHSSKRSRLNSSLSKAERGEDGFAYSMQKPQGTSLVQRDQDQDPGRAPYDNRILRVLAISPAGRCINQFKSVAELLKGLCDAIKVHRSLYLDGNILHRDISENNIIITDPRTADGFNGMLIDLDLAKEEGKGPSGARQRTGTMEFMAIEVLLGISHTYRHDLEAFLYVLIWLCARRGWALSRASDRRPGRSMLWRWYTGSYQDIAQNKRGDMDKNGLEAILEEFPEDFDCVKPLCRRVRDVLFPHKDGLFTGTPQDSKVLYNPIITAFNDAIAGIEQGETEG